MHVSTFDEPDTVWRQRSADLSWREIDGEVIVLDLKSANYLRLNSTGAKLWTRLETGATVGQLVEVLQDGFGRTPQEAMGDTVDFLTACEQQGLIEA
jgi:hypothetical protein